MGRDSEIRANQQLTWSRLSFVGLLAYFGLAIVPELWPAFGQVPLFLLYQLSVPLVVFVLCAIGVSSGVGWIVARHRHSAPQPSISSVFRAALVGLLFFALSVGFVALVSRGLPTGSHVLHFDRAAWLAPTSSEHVAGDITPRQKMLGDVVHTCSHNTAAQKSNNCLARRSTPGTSKAQGGI